MSYMYCEIVALIEYMIRDTMIRVHKFVLLPVFSEYISIEIFDI